MACVRLSDLSTIRDAAANENSSSSARKIWLDGNTALQILPYYRIDAFWCQTFSHLDGEGLSRDVPSQTEMTLIYQSAAWILAGILLAVVIFLLVAVLMNRRKNWVQMSCYGAPKKVSDPRTNDVIRAVKASWN